MQIVNSKYAENPTIKLSPVALAVSSRIKRERYAIIHFLNLETHKKTATTSAVFCG